MLAIDFNPPRDFLSKFSIAALIAFPLIGTVLHFLNGWVPISAFWVLLGFGVGTYALSLLRVWPPVRWVFVLVVLIGLPIGFVVSNVLLGLIYYLMFTPMALWFRLIGRDAMRRKLEPSASSYWDEREPDVPANRYFRLF